MQNYTQEQAKRKWQTYKLALPVFHDSYKNRRTVDIFGDMNMMHAFYGVHDKVKELTPEILKEFLAFRINFLQEELDEMTVAVKENNAEEVVDALIDLIVVAAGTLDLYEVDSSKAWNEVLVANMNKTPGVKATRPNKFGLPDLIKPEGWTAPSHTGNHGLLTSALV
jgi:predicted HAD superfamily Cof-like phosphohydrolase